MKLRVVIADDEALSRERLRELLRAEPQIEIAAECATGQEAVEAIRQKSPHLVFLDVKMPELDGFGVLEKLGGRRRPAIIFVTAHDQFALRAFEVHAVDYLLKPFDRARFQTALDRARERLERHSPGQNSRPLSDLVATLEACLKLLERVLIKSQGRIAFVNTAEIDWIDAADNYAQLHVGKSSHLLRVTITALGKQLPPDRFIRVSRSVMVNLDRIQEIRPKSHGDFRILLRDGTRLLGSRNYRQTLARLLGESR